ncbi:hypothetical protein [Massilia sp. BHUDP2]|uniref:hypothetical protein n=1 Tax=Massilia sp. BHUDP2 TaxID=3034505 RepID=UPI003906A329
MLFYQLLRPFAYIFIHHPVKRKVDWYLPLALTAITIALIAPFREGMNVWATFGVVATAQGLVQALPGFYIAALAAVATFGQRGSSLDSIIPAPTPTIQTRFAGAWIEMKLSRRRFLCLLFAYLTAVSIVLSLFATYGQAIAGPARAVVASLVVDVLSWVMFGFYLLFLFQMVAVTLWGLYYLSDRMLQPDPFESSDSPG